MYACNSITGVGLFMSAHYRLATHTGWATDSQNRS